jgi:hypothetical protein
MTQDEVMEIMTDMGLHVGGMGNWVPDNVWWKFAKLVAQREREACAQVCEGRLQEGLNFDGTAEVIRGRAYL